MLKAYRYLIYRLYSWRLQRKDNIPATTVESILCVVHVFQIYTLYTALIYFFPRIHEKFRLSNLQILIGAMAFQLLYHIFIYSKKKWSDYVNEFKDESVEQRKKKTFWMRVFLIGSIVLFFICLPIFGKR